MTTYDSSLVYKVVIVDLVGTKCDHRGNPDCSEVAKYIEKKGGGFHRGPTDDSVRMDSGIHFFYQPGLSTKLELLDASGQYDGIIAAATVVPHGCQFQLGGVRIGAGTGNMRSVSWGGSSGLGGDAPLMNTPSFNTRVTAHMVFKALLKVYPDLPVEKLHRRIVDGDFDTAKDLVAFPTDKLEGKRIAVIGYGSIGREIARLARAFAMEVVVHAHSRHKPWIESEGFHYADTIAAAATDAQVISFHIGLGSRHPDTGVFANTALINDEVFNRLKPGAIVLNYDRGEIIEIGALDKAIAKGLVAYAAIDADIIKDPSTNTLSGPLQPYRLLARRFPDRLALLPHAAADTDHSSRVAGAKQAVDQIFDVIRSNTVTNLVGDLPTGFRDLGRNTVKGVGAVSLKDFSTLANNAEQLESLKRQGETMATFWSGVSAAQDSDARDRFIREHAADFLKNANIYSHRLGELGLQGPLYE